MFEGGNVCVPVYSLFSLPMLAFLIFSPPIYNFHLFLPTKLVSVVTYFSLTDYPKLILHWYACSADGRSLARSVYGHVITKFSGMGRLPHFLRFKAPPTSGASRRAWSSATNVHFLMPADYTIPKPI